MKNINFLIFGILFIFCLNFIYATEDFDFTFRINQNADLKIPVFLENKTIATNTTTCTIEVFYPNATLMVGNRNATYNVGYYNYTLTNANLNVNGDYTGTLRCISADQYGFTPFSFQINSSGTNLTLQQSILYIIILIFSFIIFLLCLYGAIKIPYSNKIYEEDPLLYVNYYKHFKTTLWFFSYLLFTWFIFLLWQISDNFFVFDLAGNFFYSFFIFLISIAFPMFAIMSFYTLITVLRDKKLEKLLIRGLKPR